MTKANVLVISGDGLNCENETLRAFNIAGANGTILHINELLQNPKILHKFNILAIPGGFSFGDEINSGQVLALKLKHSLQDDFNKFKDDGKLIIGICNGFQTLVKLGAFTEKDEKTFTLGHNRSEQFIDKWTSMSVNPNTKCIWTKGLNSPFSLPIRHAEGKVYFKGTSDNQKLLFEKMNNQGQIALTYQQDVNGSYERIAGVCDQTGRIFGLMPHPEAAINELTNPYKEANNTEEVGLNFFKNAVNFIETNF